MGMNMSFKKEHRQETIIYLVLWALLFMAPVMSLSVRSANTGIDFDWSEIFTVWKQYALYFLVFLIHNHLMAPMLVYRQQRWRYLALSAAIIVIFQVYQCNHRPDFRQRKARRAMIEQIDHQRPPMPPDHREGDFEPRPDDHEGFEPRPDGPRRDGLRHERRQHPPLIFGQHDLVSIIILVLMLGMNLGVKLYFKQKADQRQLTELEHKNLEQQLEYLKYQLNPHFLMNTLNNIHALVDIDGERAKEAIIQLSKILRYVLYESNHERVSVNKELEFMQNYTDLMRMRYGKKLQFTDTSCQLVTPGTDQPQMIPPLLFISFVENAFKHGVSYQQPSFIEITGKRYKDKQEHNRLLWSCRNSKHQKQQQTTVPQQGGVGMANVRQRLDIIFGNNYTLNVNETDNTYEVTLDIPMEA